MDYWPELTPKPDFAVLATTSHSQAATLVVSPDARTTGTADAATDQWLYVLAGQGRAAIANEAVELGPGALILIEAGEPHEIHNLGDVPLEAFYICAPPLHREPAGTD